MSSSSGVIPGFTLTLSHSANSHVQPSGPVMEQTFVSEVEMVTAPGMAEQKGLEVSPNPPGGTRMCKLLFTFFHQYVCDNHSSATSDWASRS